MLVEFLVHLANHSKAIHGDKQQSERDWVLNEFKTGKSPIMVATDVASRGIGMIRRNPLYIDQPPFPSPFPSPSPSLFPKPLTLIDVV